MEPTGEYGFLKDSLPSPILLQLNSFSDIKTDLYKNTFLAAHTRYSTVGLNSWENSHPFECGKYLGMQNGTIGTSCNHKYLVPGMTSPHEVDSASVFWSMEQQGIEATFDEYEGEGVFLFFDTEASTFNIIKNKHRTLHFAKLTGYSTYLYSTDKAALQLVCDRASLDIDEIYALKNDTLLTYTLDGNLTQTPIIVKEPTYNWGKYGTSYGSYGGSSRSTYGSYSKPATSSKVSTLPVKHSHIKPDDTDDLDSLLDPIAPSKRHSYLIDCDNCASPLYVTDKIYADDPNLLTAKTVCCDDCKSEIEKLTGRTMHLVPDHIKGDYSC